jgi:hypothetical protein
MKLCFFTTFLFELIVIEKLSLNLKVCVEMYETIWVIHSFSKQCTLLFCKIHWNFYVKFKHPAMISWQFSEVFNKF